MQPGFNLCLTTSRQIIRFPIITQHSKGTHYFRKVAGLEVINIRQRFR